MFPSPSARWQKQNGTNTSCASHLEEQLPSPARFLAEHFGPVFGGLFLAFPAIFPASATLVAKHETHKKQNAGIETNSRGRQAVAVDAAGAPLGSVGLAAFALTVWKFLPYYNSAFVFLAAKRFGSRWPSSLGAFGENTVAVSHFS